MSNLSWKPDHEFNLYRVNAGVVEHFHIELHGTDAGNNTIGTADWWITSTEQQEGSDEVGVCCADEPTLKHARDVYRDMLKQGFKRLEGPFEKQFIQDNLAPYSEDWRAKLAQIRVKQAAIINSREAA